jgi:pyrroloquinoline quinone biosynthesis protein B
VQVVLLGSAAGGGFPQWNCWCPGCRTARSSPAAAHPRSQSSAAVSEDGRHWFLLNASPDVRDQVARLHNSTPDGARHVPVEGVVLTDAELHHTLGLVLLREAGRLPIYATAAVTRILEDDSRLLPTVRAFSDLPVTTLELGQRTSLLHRDGTPSGLAVDAFTVPADPPRFASHAAHDHTIGLMVREAASGIACAFVPGCGRLDGELLERLAAADALLFDGTFWSDDELIALGVGRKTARQMDHLPIGGADGSLEQLAALPCRYRIYTHINNTNPILLEQSAERASVTRAGMMVGFDGLRLTL